MGGCHNLTLPSADADSSLAAGVERQARHRAGVCAEEGGLLAVALVPEADRLIVAGRGEELAVGAEGDGVDGGGVAGELSLRLLEIGQVPGADDLVGAAGEQPLAVGTDRPPRARRRDASASAPARAAWPTA